MEYTLYAVFFRGGDGKTRTYDLMHVKSEGVKIRIEFCRKPYKFDLKTSVFSVRIDVKNGSYCSRLAFHIA